MHELSLLVVHCDVGVGGEDGGLHDDGRAHSSVQVRIQLALGPSRYSGPMRQSCDLDHLRASLISRRLVLPLTSSLTSSDLYTQPTENLACSAYTAPAPYAQCREPGRPHSTPSNPLPWLAQHIGPNPTPSPRLWAPPPLPTCHGLSTHTLTFHSRDVGPHRMTNTTTQLCPHL